MKSKTTGTSATQRLDAAVMEHIQEIQARMQRANTGGAAKEKQEPRAEEEAPRPALEGAELVDGERWFTDMFGIGEVPNGLPNLPMTVFSAETFEVTARELIPEVEETYYPQGMNEYMFTKAMRDNQRVLLTGPKGSGKSTLPKQYAALVNQPFFRVQARRTTEAEDLFGNISVRGGNVVFNDGPITTAARVGGLVCLDEASLLQPGAAMALQWLLEPGGKISLPDYPSNDAADKIVTPHPSFRIVLTDNTTLAGDHTGEYVGTNVQNAAFRDRIDMFIRVGYMSPESERAMLKKHVTGIPDSVLKSMVQLATEVRAGYENRECDCTVSPRVLLRWAKDTVAFGNAGLAFLYTFVNSVGPEDQVVLSTIYQKVFGKQLPKVA
jgi:cobaltochelatase CobS